MCVFINNDAFIILMFQMVGHTLEYCDISVIERHWISKSTVHDKVPGRYINLPGRYIFYVLTNR
jgi:hypothetical protein